MLYHRNRGSSSILVEVTNAFIRLKSYEYMIILRTCLSSSKNNVGTKRRLSSESRHRVPVKSQTMTDLSLDPGILIICRGTYLRTKCRRRSVLDRRRLGTYLPVAIKFPSLENAQHATYLLCPDIIAITFPVLWK